MKPKILYCGLLYNYGKPEEGYSYEYYNIEAGLRECDDVETWIHHLDGSYNKEIRAKILQNDIDLFRPDIILYVAFNEEYDLDSKVLADARVAGIKVVEFDCDASWRFNNWILPRAGNFTHFITTHSSTVPWYQKHGLKVIKSQWGASPFCFPGQGPKKYDVTFIGQKHGIRPQIIQGLKDRGIKVDLFGHYWEGYDNYHDYLTSFWQVRKVFQESKIALNLSNPWHVGTLPQIKGRHFEIPACGTFQLSTPADDLENYFIPNKEIVIANDINQLADKIKYYLEHNEEREAIARAGYERCQKDHSWQNRVKLILKELGF